MSSFIRKFTSSIIATLCCFDRVIFKGYLPFGNGAQLNSFVDHVLRIRRKDFIPLLHKHSETLVSHAKALAEKAGRPDEYRQGKFRKETFIQDIIGRGAISDDPKDPRLRRRLAARISRLLKRLHIRALIAKIPHSRRWRITKLGQKLLGAVVQLHYHGLAQAA